MGAGPSVVILCGGRGTRAYPHTVDLPKPLLEVAGRPILHHVMEIYRRQGDFSFVLAAGFRADLIESFADSLRPTYRVQVIDSGIDANTAERVAACRDHLTDRFYVTYGDGVGNVDIAGLTAFHADHGGLGTITTVPLPSQYGTIDSDPSGRIRTFKEKPILTDHWINGGFFAFDSGVWDHWAGRDLEKEVLPTLSRNGHLFAYRHSGFWKSMDTYKDGMDLTALASSDGDAPWYRDLPPAPDADLVPFQPLTVSEK